MENYLENFAEVTGEEQEEISALKEKLRQAAINAMRAGKKGKEYFARLQQEYEDITGEFVSEKEARNF